MLVVAVFMSRNADLIAYFAQEIYSGDFLALADNVTSDFKFNARFMKGLSFAQFHRFISSLSNDVSIKLIETVSDDEITFTTIFCFEVINRKHKYIREIKGRTITCFEGDKIKTVDLHYRINGELITMAINILSTAFFTQPDLMSKQIDPSKTEDATNKDD